jgi:hypothetical protein
MTEVHTAEMKIQVVEVPQLLISVKKAGEVLDISGRAVYDLCYQGELESVMVGPNRGMRRILCDSLQRYVERRRDAAQSPDDHRDLALHTRAARGGAAPGPLRNLRTERKSNGQA